MNLGCSGWSSDQLRRKWREISAFDLPAGIHLPIRIRSTPYGEEALAEAVNQGRLPPYAPRVTTATKSLNPMTRSTLLFGWEMKCTTITRNIAAVRSVEERLRTETGILGGAGNAWMAPKTWTRGEARSFLATEKEEGPLSIHRKLADARHKKTRDVDEMEE